MKILFNLVSLLVLIAYCLYSDGAKMNGNVNATVDKIVKLSSVTSRK